MRNATGTARCANMRAIELKEIESKADSSARSDPVQATILCIGAAVVFVDVENAKRRNEPGPQGKQKHEEKQESKFRSRRKK